MTEYTCLAWHENGKTTHAYVPTKALPGSSVQPDDLASVTAELEQARAEVERLREWQRRAVGAIRCMTEAQAESGQSCPWCGEDLAALASEVQP